MPLGQPSSNSCNQRRIGEVLGLGNGAGHEAVEHAIGKARQQLRRQAVLHQQLVVRGLAFSVDNHGGAIAVGAQQHGIPVHLGLGQARLPMDGLEQRVSDAVGEADEVDVVSGPLGKQALDEPQGRFL